MKKLLILLPLLIISCSLFSEWQFFGLSGHEVWEIRIHDNFLYAATDNGLYRKNLEDDHNEWTHLGLENISLTSMAIVDESTFIAGRKNYSEDMPGFAPILRTDDGGVNWYDFSEGLEYSGEFRTNSIDLHHASPSAIFSSGISTVRKLVEPSDYWEVVWGDWDLIALGVHFIRISTNDPGVVWAGGELGGFVPFLLKSYNSGEDWVEFYLQGFIGGDNACHIIAFDPYDNDVVYAGMEGRIIKSTDGGYNWTIILNTDTDDNLKYFDTWGLAVSENNNQVIYASGDQRFGEEPLLLYISQDGGTNWETIEGGMGQRSSFSLAYRPADEKDEVFIATFGDGVFKYTRDPNPLSLDENPVTAPATRLLYNYPNPFNNRTNIAFILEEDSFVNLSIYNVKGSLVTSLIDEHLEKGEHRISWNGYDASGQSYPSGIYFSVLKTGSQKTVHKMLLLK